MVWHQHDPNRVPSLALEIHWGDFEPSLSLGPIYVAGWLLWGKKNGVMCLQFPNKRQGANSGNRNIEMFFLLLEESPSDWFWPAHRSAAFHSKALSLSLYITARVCPRRPARRSSSHRSSPLRGSVPLLPFLTSAPRSLPHSQSPASEEEEGGVARIPRLAASRRQLLPFASSEL